MRVIMLWCSRECWNGRQARLRCVWFRRVGSSPISRTKYLQIPDGIWRYLYFRERWNSKGGLENSPVGCFPAVGESSGFETHPLRMWIKSGYSRYSSTSVTAHFLISTRSSHQISPNPRWDLEIFLFLREMGTRKADQKTVRWTVFPPWESPPDLRRIRYGCGSNSDNAQNSTTHNLDFANLICYILLLENNLQDVFKYEKNSILYCHASS